MKEKRQTLVVQITRGLAPAVSIAHVVEAVHRYRVPYQLLQGMPAAKAKQTAAELALSKNMDLLLCEDDFIAPIDVWDKAIALDHTVGVASATMRNGEINIWRHVERIAFCGTVFVKIPHVILSELPQPIFMPRQLTFNDEAGCWIDKGPCEKGTGSDVHFWRLCWDAGVHAELLGSVTHLIHEFNCSHARLDEPSAIKPMGVVVARRVVHPKEREVAHHG